MRPREIPRHRLLEIAVTCFVIFLILLCVFLSTNCASATTGKALNVAVVGAGIADVVSTRQALDQGRGREGNAVMGQGVWPQIVIKGLGVSTVIGLASLLEQRDHGRLAHVVRSIVIVGWSVVAAQNVTVGR